MTNLMINDKIHRLNIPTYASFLILFIFGFFILVLRNPDPFINLIIYTEDGTWTGRALVNGWIDILINARNDYLVVLNILLLLLSTKLSFLISGNVLTELPFAIAIISVSFFSLIPAMIFSMTKDIIPLTFRIILYFLIIFMPLGASQNEIIGRLSNIGYYMPIIATFLLFFRSYNKDSALLKGVIDLIILLCIATNPVVLPLVMLYLYWDFYIDMKLTRCLKENLFLMLTIGFLGIFIFFRMVYSRIHDPLATSEIIWMNFIEVLIARPIVYPFLFPWYTSLNNIIVILFLAICVSLIIFSYFTSNSILTKRLILFLFMAFWVFNIATIVMRPTLTLQLSSYQNTFPDRYFMGLNIFVTVLLISSLSQIILLTSIIYKAIGWLLTLILVLIYVSHMQDILETTKSKMPIMTHYDFIDQTCMGTSASNSLVSIIPIYFEGWTMTVPNYLIDKSQCIDRAIPIDKSEIISGKYSVFFKKKLTTFQLILSSANHKAFDLTDINWIKGFHRIEPMFFIPNSSINKKDWLVGDTIKLANGDMRKITAVIEQEAYLHIYFDGLPLDGALVGYPHQIEIIKEKK